MKMTVALGLLALDTRGTGNRVLAVEIKMVLLTNTTSDSCSRY